MASTIAYQSNHLKDTYNKQRTKVKSGCRTCKIRKVKCDEGRPACKRCVATDRVCDGYGIWGGGGNYYGQRQSALIPKEEKLNLWQAGCVLFPNASLEELRSLEWFKHRTLRKLPGLFVLKFWDTLVIQASVNEPAIFHAVLALSSVQKRETVDNANSNPKKAEPDEQELFTLQNYVKAISHASPRLLDGDRPSVRVALISCVLFICLELLQGHFRTAQNHLESGLQVLRQVRSLCCVQVDAVLLLQPSHEPIDDWIVEAFCRLQVQLLLLKQNFLNSCLTSRYPGHNTPNGKFASFNEAWMRMEGFINDIYHLSKTAREQCMINTTDHTNPPGLFERQQILQKTVELWIISFEKSRNDPQAMKAGRERYQEFAYRLLRSYHTIVKIMAATCLCLDDEIVFDHYTEEFISLISESISNWKNTPVDPHGHGSTASKVHTSQSVIDIGWIPPLFYTAIKCRVHRIRLQAIRLLETTSHREGFWDSTIAACVARKVVEIEERNFYKGVAINDCFPLDSSPELRDLSLPVLPRSHRICDIELILPDDSSEGVVVKYVQQQRDGVWEPMKCKYNVYQQRWVDEPTGRCLQSI